jgi:hypothetical protein
LAQYPRLKAALVFRTRCILIDHFS